MRHVLAVAVLGASLALTASAALADENTDHTPIQFRQSEVVVNPIDSGSAVVAGVAAPQSVYAVSREDNRER
ncbi:MAG TPA: hypothetical protein VKV57_14155 [bacterium]|nr:hypothetical protein [bacterium]